MPLLTKSRRPLARKQRSLRLRGDIIHTFGTLLTPFALACVVLGFYLLASAFLNPLAADSMTLLTASILLSLGFMLASYILRSAMHGTRSSSASRRRTQDLQRRPVSIVGGALDSPKIAESPLPFQRNYVDSARIRR